MTVSAAMLRIRLSSIMPYKYVEVTKYFVKNKQNKCFPISYFTNALISGVGDKKE